MRTHRNRIFSKTCTRHQAQLVALLLAGPARLQVEYDESEDWDEADGRLRFRA